MKTEKAMFLKLKRMVQKRVLDDILLPGPGVATWACYNAVIEDEHGNCIVAVPPEITTPAELLEWFPRWLERRGQGK